MVGGGIFDTLRDSQEFPRPLLIETTLGTGCCSIRGEL